SRRGTGPGTGSRQAVRSGADPCSYHRFHRTSGADARPPERSAIVGTRRIAAGRHLPSRAFQRRPRASLFLPDGGGGIDLAATESRNAQFIPDSRSLRSVSDVQLFFLFALAAAIPPCPYLKWSTVANIESTSRLALEVTRANTFNCSRQGTLS